MPFELGRAVDIVRSALSELDGGPRVLVGHSLGAVVALETAVRHPTALNALVLVSGFARAPRALLRAQQRVFGLAPARLYARQGLDKRSMTGPMAQLLSFDRGREAATLRVPTLVVCGGKDRLNLRGADELNRLVPGSSLCVVPGVGHLVPEQAPVALARAISDHLAQVASS